MLVMADFTREGEKEGVAEFLLITLLGSIEGTCNHAADIFALQPMF